MAHRDRLANAVHLSSTLGRCPISLDDGTLGENTNGERAWSLHDPAADFHIVIQDDAVPIAGLAHHAAAALAHAPHTAVSLYIGRGRPASIQPRLARLTARDDTPAWIEHPELHWGVAVAMPTAAIPGYLAWVHARAGRYDKLIGTYWRQHGQPVRYTWPSLVDHADTDTLIRHAWRQSPPRRAWRVGIPDTWDTPPAVI